MICLYNGNIRNRKETNGTKFKRPLHKSWRNFASIILHKHFSLNILKVKLKSVLFLLSQFREKFTFYLTNGTPEISFSKSIKIVNIMKIRKQGFIHPEKGQYFYV